MDPFLVKVGDQTVFIKNLDSFRNTLSRFILNGAKDLNVIADFDYTLTKWGMNGVRCLSCHGVIEHADGLVSAQCTKQTVALLRKYWAIERDINIPYADKFKHMEEWAQLVLAILSKERINRSKLETAVANMFRHDLKYSDNANDSTNSGVM